MDKDAPFAARRGKVLCILTSLGAGDGRGDTWKTVVLEFLGVSEDSIVTMQGERPGGAALRARYELRLSSTAYRDI